MKNKINRLKPSDRKDALKWWNKIQENDRILFSHNYYKGRPHTSLTGREIEKIWKDQTNLKCNFSIYEKVKYNNEKLTVINNSGIIINNILHIPCANKDNIIDDYPVNKLKKDIKVFIVGEPDTLEIINKSFTYDDMFKIYNLGREDALKSNQQVKYIDNHKDWINENFK